MRSSIFKSELLAWLEKQAEQKPTLRERYKNIAESEWFKKTHDGMSVSNDEEPKWTDDDEKIRKALIEYFNEQCDMSDWNGVYGYQVVAWLEKQGEQKPQRMISAEAKEAMYGKPAYAWSEEDEEHYQACLQYFDAVNPDMVYYKDYQWLKSLKERIGE